jgi:predicted lipoprotein
MKIKFTFGGTMARAAGSARSWGLISALAVAGLLKAACDGGKDGPGDEVDDVLAAMLADLGPRVVSPALARAGDAAGSLEAATTAWRDATAAGGDGEVERAAAQTAWWALMSAWQEVELHQIGPAGSSITAVGGADLRDEVYSWPTVNRCRVDQETVTAEWDADDFFETRLLNVYGLDALEFLIYAPPGENDCGATVDINAEGTWDALGVEGVQRNRAAYAAVLAAHVRANVDALQTAWDPAGGDFTGQVAGAGESGSVYESATQALNAVFDGLFYLEVVTKDRKLGYAVGESACEASCTESPLAGGSHAWVAINLAAFRTLYLGGEGAGMDELLRSIGEDALADDLLARLDTADAAAAAVGAPFDTADPTAVRALYDAVKGVTDLLKGDVATVLALQIPAEAAGDAD